MFSRILMAIIISKSWCIMNSFDQSLFKNKLPNNKALINYGFKLANKNYQYQTTLPTSNFKVDVTIDAKNAISARLTDPVSKDPYVLHTVEGASGDFINNVRSELHEILTDIVNHCFDDAIFKAPQTKRLIDQINSTYQVELEFLWKKFPNNAVYRRADTHKWFGAILTTSTTKLGLEKDQQVEIIDLRAPVAELPDLLTTPHFYPGYHMNKKHWYSIILDDSISDEEVIKRVAASFSLAI